MYTKSLLALALVASANAFAPASFGVRTSTSLFFEFGKYDDQVWGSEAKDEVYAAWDPAVERTSMNFNPYETWKGNSCDASGRYPGETWYKDPARPDVSYALMQEEKAAIEARNANPKPGDVPGAPGCRN